MLPCHAYSAHQEPLARNLLKFLVLFLIPASLSASPFREGLEEFVEFHCYDCHGDGASKGGFDIQKLSADLDDEAAFAKWERVYDRVLAGEMPPKKKDRPEAGEVAKFQETLSPALTEAHAAHKGTVLRRLNRNEYQNTLNDIFGTELPLAELLPDDGRSGGFDTVGDALGISVVQMQRYLEAMGLVIDAATAKTASRPELGIINPRYDTHEEAKKVFIDKVWGYTPDKAVVFFKQHGYPKGNLRSSDVKESGRYRIKVTGYNYQSDKPVTFSIGGSSWEKGTGKPLYAFRSFPMGGPSTVEIETTIKKGYMVAIEPWGICDKDDELRKVTAKNYKGPGVAILDVKVEGPLLDEWPSSGHQLLFEGLDREEIEPSNPKDKTKHWYEPKFAITNPPEDVTPVLKRLATVAFRRPVEDSELTPYADLFKSELDGGKSHSEALRSATIAIFTSPDFLFLRERPGKLDDHAIASRLSYFLTRSTPDPELLGMAAAGKLATETRSQAERLIADPRFERFVTDFTDSWLNLRDIDATSPDNLLYYEYDEFLQKSILDETRSYFRHLVRRTCLSAMW